MRHLAIATLVALGTAGCLGDGREAKINAAVAEVKVAEADCRERHKARQIKTNVGLAQCINEAENRIAGYMMEGRRDLFAVVQAARVALAEKVDHKKLTQAEADFEFAKIKSGAASDNNQRANRRAHRRGSRSRRSSGTAASQRSEAAAS